MKGSIYGVDIKLTKNDSEISPVGIEMNGVDFGTDFFKYEEGCRYYKKLATVLSACANGKPIFIQSYKDSRPLHVLEKIAQETEYREIHKERRERAEKIASYIDESYDFEYSWLDDLLSFNLKNLDKHEENEERWAEHAARDLGIPLFLFETIAYRREKVIFTLLNGKKQEFSKEDIGLIWAKSPKLYKVPYEYTGLFLNSSLAELLGDSKPMFREYSERYSQELLECFAPGISYGFGITEKEELLDFLDGIEGEFVVRKRGGSYCGTGVEIFEKERLMKTLKRPHEEVGNDKKRAMLYYVMKQVSNGRDLEEFLSVYEEFIPSVPILNSKTHQYHDGCIRAVVFKPKDEEPIFVDAQWRLAPAPLDADTSLEEKLRANLSRGATPQDLSDEEIALVSPFARGLVEGYEHLIEKMEGYLDTIIPRVNHRERFKMWLIKQNFWGCLLRDQAKRLGNYESAHINPDIRIRDLDETISKQISAWERVNRLREFAEQYDLG